VAQRGTGRERDRYGRKSWRERLTDAWASIRDHPRITTAALAVAGLLGVMLLLRPTDATLARLAAGDCLYLRPGGAVTVPAVPPFVRVPDETGDDDPEFAEFSGCRASHSHEVIALVDLGAPSRELPGPEDGLPDAIAACGRAFAAATGGSSATRLRVELLVPSEAGWAAGRRTGACLVSRTDGGFLDRPVSEVDDPG
jgi:hypothetical protein